MWTQTILGGTAAQRDHVAGGRMLFIRFISDEERKKSCLDVIVINGLSFFLSIIHNL